MGQQSQFRQMAGARKPKNSPPVMSQEFIIQNHGDIFSCIIVLVFAGFMFQATTSIATIFVAPQYNTTEYGPDGLSPVKVTYRNGVRDLATVVFYMMCAIVVHAVIQEYVLDKLQRKLHLSKTKTSKFTESGHLALFALYSIAHAGYIINTVGNIFGLPYKMIDKRILRPSAEKTAKIPAYPRFVHFDPAEIYSGH